MGVKERSRLRVGAIALAAVALLYVAFSGGPSEDPTKLTSNTSQGQPEPPAKEPTPPVKVDPIKKIVPPEPTKLDPTKLDPTKLDPAIDPTKTDPGETDPNKKGVEVPPVKPKLDPASEQCKKTREKVGTARNALNFHDMLRLLNDKGCWQSKGEHGKLKTLAYKELGKFRECAAAGRGNTDPEVVKWVNLCTRRAESG